MSIQAIDLNPIQYSGQSGILLLYSCLIWPVLHVLQRYVQSKKNTRNKKIIPLRYLNFILFLLPNLGMSQLSLDYSFNQNEDELFIVFHQRVDQIKNDIEKQNDDNKIFDDFRTYYIIEGNATNDNKIIQNQSIKIVLKFEDRELEYNFKTDREGNFEILIPIKSFWCFVGETTRSWKRYLKKANPKRIDFRYNNSILRKKNKVIKILDSNYVNPTINIDLEFNR